MTFLKPLSRRQALAALAGAASLAAFPARAAVGSLRAISVDASAIARHGAPGYARIVERQLAASLARTFADRLDPRDRNAPALVARIDSVYLSDYAGGNRGRYGAASSGDNDYIDGVGVLLGGGAQGTYPILSVLDASSTGPWHAPDVDSRRLAALSDHFAWWLRRKMGI